MTAIYKKELRSYFTSMTGYICMAFMLVDRVNYYAVINLVFGPSVFAISVLGAIVYSLMMFRPDNAYPCKRNGILINA